MKKLNRGILISVEGIDGSGKSTLVANLTRHLLDLHYPITVTREPGATPLGSLIRSIVQKKEAPRYAKAEYLLFAADRAQHFEEIVIPALSQGQLVISDRLADSSLVYQGYGRGLDIATIGMINQWAMASYTPHLTLYVKIDVDTAMERLHKRTGELSAFEQEKRSFTQKLVAGFDELFANNPRVYTIDGTQDEKTVCDNALYKVTSWLNSNNLIQ